MNAIALLTTLLCAVPVQQVGPRESRTFRFAGHVQKVESEGWRMFSFSLPGSDGRRYDVKSLTAKGPVLLVNLTMEGPPRGVADLNRLGKMMRGKVRVVGLLNDGRDEEPMAQMRAAVKRYGIRFLLLRDFEFATIPALQGYDGNIFYFCNALLLPNGRLTHVWCGYDRWTLGRMRRDAWKYAKIRLDLDLSKFPVRLKIGGGGFLSGG